LLLIEAEIAKADGFMRRLKLLRDSEDKKKMIL
jgi:hypothetical protein